MIASKIEVFTIYHWTNEINHVYIDNYEDGVVFKKTKKNQYPIPNSQFNISSPWDLSHGTCIRMHLKSSYSLYELMLFLSKNLLRVGIPLYLKYNNYEKELTQIWHYREGFDYHCYDRNIPLRYFETNRDSEKCKTEADIFDLFYMVKERDFYSGPPRDFSIENNKFEMDYIKGEIDINYASRGPMPCRISQNGILIEDAIDFILNDFNNYIYPQAFGFDIDLYGKYQLQLDAERTRIISNGYNTDKFKLISNILLDKYFDLVSNIESTIYFQCGGRFYHGIQDVLFNNPNSVKCFHEVFTKVFRNDENKVPQNYQNSFNKAKLYMHGITRNNPISVSDILESSNLKYLLILKNEILKKGYSTDIDGNLKNKGAKKVMEAIEKDYDDNLVYLPNDFDTYIYPLIENFDFELYEENEYFKVLVINKEKNNESNANLKFFKDFFKEKTW